MTVYASLLALLAAMDAACDDITAEACWGWIHHSRRYFPCCFARADRQECLDVPEWFKYVQLQYVVILFTFVPSSTKRMFLMLILSKWLQCIFSFARCCRIRNSLFCKNVKFVFTSLTTAMSFFTLKAPKQLRKTVKKSPASDTCTQENFIYLNTEPWISP